jgi:hypothetical protein
VSAEAVPATAPESRSGLPPWGYGEMPAPPRARGRELFAILGPGVIVLGAAIGSGEWLIGPVVTVRYGLTLLWATTVAVFLQTVFNGELMRYTLYTGEPAFTGFMRTRPHSSFWAAVYALLFVLQTGWPGWAGAAAGAIFFLARGRVPTPPDAGAVYWLGVATFLACVAIVVLSRRSIERTLEILNWVLVSVILGTLAILCLLWVRPSLWLSAALGWFGYDTATASFRFVPEGADFFLIGAFVAYSGSGGVTNIALSNWARDKGYGMASTVGFIPSLRHETGASLAPTGRVFVPDAASLGRWRGWWRIVELEQWGIFFVGAMLGMSLPALLYTSVFPRGTDLAGVAVSAELARALGRTAGALAVVVALMSVWILFKTQLDIFEASVRSLTDILWSASARVRSWRGGDVRLLYHVVLAVLVLWGVVALSLTQPLILLQIGANMGGVVMVVAPLHLLRVNTTLLPEALRPPLWRRFVLVAMAVFYGVFVWLWLMGGLRPDSSRGFVFVWWRVLGL